MEQFLNRRDNRRRLLPSAMAPLSMGSCDAAPKSNLPESCQQPASSTPCNVRQPLGSLRPRAHISEAM